MHTYTLLQDPSHLSAYLTNAYEVAVSELRVVQQSINQTLSQVRRLQLGNIQYIAFDTPQELTPDELTLLSQLSFTFALYKLVPQGEEALLLPLIRPHYEQLAPKLSTLLKYSGKTNHLFTRMMINVARATSSFNAQNTLTLLDPIAGRGTTLYEAAILGYNTVGVEIEKKSVHDINIYFKKFLEKEKIKHSIDRRRITGTNKENAVQGIQVDYALTKAQFKDKSLCKSLTIINGNTTQTHRYLKAGSVHLIVGDLPYGILHANTGNKKDHSFTRNSIELLEASLPAYYKVLKTGGTLVLALNTLITSKREVQSLLVKNGFILHDQAPYSEFEHRVDQSIKRDIVVASM